MRRNTENTIGTILLVGVLLFALAWVVNAVKFVNCDFDAPYRCEVLHGIGLVPLLAPVFVWADSD